MKKISDVVIISICLALVFQGLYFTHLWLVYMVLMAILLMVCYYLNKELNLPKDMVFWFLCVNSLMHLLLTPLVLEKGMQVFAFMQSFMYVMFYVLIHQLPRDYFIRRMKIAFISSLTLFGYANLLSYGFGWFASMNLVINNRVAGPIQYANTYGLILVIGVLMIIRLECKWWLKSVAMIGIMVPLILTMSRGSFLVGIVLVILTWLVRRFDKATYLSLASSILIGVVLLITLDVGIADRILETTNASEWQTRLLYYKDGLVMIKDRFWGYGYQGYYYAKNFYRTGSLYHVRFIHSSLLQSFLNMGVMGGLLMTTFMGYVVCIRKVHMDHRIMVMGILGHSLVDLDLEFPFVWLLILTLLVQETTKMVQLRRWSVPLVGNLVIGLVSVYLLLATISFNQQNYTQALKLYPFYTEASRKVLLENISLGDKADVARTLVRRNPYIDQAYEVLVDEALSRGAYQEALDFSRAITYYNPIDISSYETYSKTLVIVLQTFIVSGDFDASRDLLEELLALPDQLAQLAKDKNTDYNVKHKPRLEMTELLMKDYVLAGQLSKKLESMDNQK